MFCWFQRNSCLSRTLVPIALSLDMAVLALHCRLVALFASSSHAAAAIEGDCLDIPLWLLALRLSPESLVSYKRSASQLLNAGRYWGEQFAKNADVVIFPATTQDVSLTMASMILAPLGHDFAVVSGAHSMTNASSSYGLVIDLCEYPLCLPAISCMPLPTHHTHPETIFYGCFTSSSRISNTDHL
jgi:hypothetical protein